MHQSEEDYLVLTAQGGDRRAVDLLYRHYYQRLVRYAYKVCGSADMAQEAVQDAWLRAMKTLGRLDDPRAFRSWLYNLVRWRGIDLLRASSRFVDSPVESVDEAVVLAGERIDDAEELRQAIHRLPAVEKQIIHLFYLDELPVNEIAIVLGIASGTVKSRLNRARKLLRDRFDV